MGIAAGFVKVIIAETPAQPPTPVQGQGETPPSCDERCQAAEQREKDDLGAQQDMARFASDLVNLTFWQIIVGTVGISLLIITLKFTRDATRAAISASEAAEDAVEVTRDTAKRQLRAYVAMEQIVWTPFNQPGTKEIAGCELKIEWKNCGSTPARRCRTRFNMRYFDNRIPKDFDYPDIGAEKIVPLTETAHIGPNGTLENAIVFMVAQAEAAQRAGRKIFAWGWIEYDDIFEETPRRRTEVCFQATISSDWRKCSPTITGPFNGADEDCHHKPKT